MTRIYNMAGLVFGYLLGQGSFLLASIILLGRGQYETATAIGFGMTLVTLAMLVVDMGGQTYLARQQALADGFVGTEASTEASKVFVQRALAGMILLRLLAWLTLLLIMLIFGVILGLFPDELSRNFTISGVVGLLFWAFNQTGILDGRKRHGWSGMTVAIPWLLTSMLIIVGSLEPWSSEKLGLLLGLTFASGLLLAVLIQAALLGSSPFTARTVFRGQGLVDALRLGGGVFLSQLLGQLSERIQIFFAVALFPVETAAAFILSRNILSASTNVVNMARRIEFPELVTLMKRGNPGVLKLLAHQRLSFIGVVVIGLVYVAGGAVAYLEYLPNSLKGSSDAFKFTLDFLPVLVVTSLSGALTQGLFALGKSSLVLTSSILSCSISSLLTWALVYQYGNLAMVVASFAANVTVATIVALSLKKMHFDSVAQ